MKKRSSPILLGGAGFLIFVAVSASWPMRTYELDANNLTEATPLLQAALWLASFLTFAGSAVWLIVLHRQSSKN